MSSTDSLRRGAGTDKPPAPLEPQGVSWEHPHMDGSTAPTPPRPQVSARCTGCGRCVAVCPPAVLSLQPLVWLKRAALHDAAGCTGCGRCVPVCPFGAVRMRRGAAP